MGNLFSILGCRAIKSALELGTVRGWYSKMLTGPMGVKMREFSKAGKRTDLSAEK